MSRLGFGVWISVLLIELYSFFIVNHSVHSIEDVYFMITLVLVTLVVGATGLYGLKKDEQ